VKPENLLAYISSFSERISIGNRNHAGDLGHLTHNTPG
jgi:hypothetical protein